MKWSDKTQLDLEPNEWDLLAWNIANEVINGFKVGDFQQRVGVSEDGFKNIAKRLRSTSLGKNAAIGTREAEALRNALALTLEELGVEEFSTRTGYEFDEGNLILQELNRFLA